MGNASIVLIAIDGVLALVTKQKNVHETLQRDAENLKEEQEQEHALSYNWVNCKILDRLQDAEKCHAQWVP